MQPIFSLSILFLFALAPLPAQERVEVGTHGATLEVGDDWQRRRFDPTLGEDQWIGRGVHRGQFLQVIELAETAEDELDFFAISSRIENILAARSTSLVAGEPQFERVGRLGIAAIGLDVEQGSIDLAFRVHVVGRDGLNFLLLHWGPARSARQIGAEARRLARSVRMPLRESEWGQRASPRERTVRSRGHVARFAVRETVLGEQGDPVRDGVLLKSLDEVLVLRVEWHEWGGSLQSLVKRIQDGVDDTGLCRTLRQREQELGEYDALETVFAVDTDPPWAAHLLVVRVTDALALEFRFAADGDAERRPELRRELFESLRIEAAPVVDAFPVVEPELKPAPAGVAPLLRVAREIGRIPRPPHSVVAHPDGRLLSSYDGVKLLADGAAAPEHLFSDEGWERWSVAWTGGRLLVALTGQGAAPVVDGALGEVEFEAKLIGAAGARVFGARQRAAWQLPGRWQTGAVADRLLEVLPDGERLVREFPGKSIERLVVEPSGRYALVAVSIDWAFEELVMVRLDDGEARSLGPWNVDCIADTTGGFIVSGARRGESRGVHLVAVDGAAELLVRGWDVIGVALDGDELRFTASWGSTGRSDGWALWSVTRDALDGLTWAGEPFDAARLGELGRACMQGAENRSALDSWLALVAMGDRVARERFGVELPQTVEEFDGLYGTCTSDADGLGHDGRMLLAALLIRTLTGSGARWIASPETRGVPAYDASPWAYDNAFAQGYVPFRVLASSLQEEEGWVAPARSILDAAAGRAIVLGDDPRAVRAEVDRLDESAAITAALAGGRVELDAFLDRFPSNVHLRTVVYELLGGAGDMTAVRDVAARFARRPGPAATDVLAWCSSRGALAAEGASDVTLIDDLRRAIVGHSDEIGLYLLLGEAYARRWEIDPSAKDRARACFDHVLAERSWGEVADRARAGLEQLDR